MLAPPWVSVPSQFSPLPPNRPPLGDSGERLGEGAICCRVASLAFRCSQIFLGTKRDLRESARSCPLTLALSPNTKNVLGEREQMVGTLTQGGTSGSCRWRCPGLPSDAPLGLYKEEAASCRFTNVQSPDSGESRNPRGPRLTIRRGDAQQVGNSWQAAGNPAKEYPMKHWTLSLLFVICVSTPLLAQTVEAPLRAVTDPGVVTTRQGITPAGVQTVFEGRVYGLAFGRASSELWVLTAGAAGTSQMQVYKLDWRSNQTLARMSSEGTAGLQGIQYDRAKDRVLISSVTRSSNKVRLLTDDNGTLKTVADALGSFTAGALAHNQQVAAVPLIYDNKLAIVNLSDGRIVSSLPTGIAPFGAVINKEGTVAYVSNWGGRVPAPKDLTAPTGLQPNADRVVIDAQGKAATGTVTRLDLASGKATHTIPVELHPTAILWDEARNRLYVANGNKDSVSVIDTAKNEVERNHRSPAI